MNEEQFFILVGWGIFPLSIIALGIMSMMN